MQFQEKLFGASIMPNLDGGRRQGQLEQLLLTLESDKRKEELDFWKDKIELKQKIFEAAKEYSATSHRTVILKDMETNYG